MRGTFLVGPGRIVRVRNVLSTGLGQMFTRCYFSALSAVPTVARVLLDFPVCLSQTRWNPWAAVGLGVGGRREWLEENRSPQ